MLARPLACTHPFIHVLGLTSYQRMKYFSYELIAAANGWPGQSESDRVEAEKRFWAQVDAYYRELETLKTRVSRAAWQFFRHGFGRYGLHDARLLSLSVGDGLNFVADGKTPFLLNRQHTSARIEFLNFEQDLHYVFALKRVSRVLTELFIDEDQMCECLGDLNTCELTSVNEKCLQLGLIFSTGATITLQFRKLVFRRRRIKRGYELGETFR